MTDRQNKLLEGQKMIKSQSYSLILLCAGINLLSFNSSPASGQIRIGSGQSSENRWSNVTSNRIGDTEPVATQAGYGWIRLGQDTDSRTDSAVQEPSASATTAATRTDDKAKPDNKPLETFSKPDDKTDEEKEKSLLDSLPLADLYGGIRNDSMGRAIANREIADPNLNFMFSAVGAPTSYREGSPFTWKTWDSPNVRYRPLYFEDENLERYGHTIGHHLQPYKSGLRFLGGVVTLPYQLAAQGTRDCEYGMGYFRPGNCNPAYRSGLERSPRGTVVQALTIGAILAGL